MTPSRSLFITDEQDYNVGDENGVYAIALNHNGTQAAVGLGSGNFAVRNTFPIFHCFFINLVWSNCVHVNKPMNTLVSTLVTLISFLNQNPLGFVQIPCPHTTLIQRP